MSPACAPPMARRSSPTTCRRNRTRWSSASSARAASSSPSPTRRSSAPAAAPSTRCSAARAIRGTPSLTCGGSTGGGAVSLATGEVWLAHGTDHGGSLRRPGTYCSVVGLRPSPGRVTRGTSNNLWSPLSVQGPMARNVARPGAVPRHDGGLLPARPADLRRAGACRSARRWPIRVAAEARRLHRRLRRPARGRPRDPRDLRPRGRARFEELGCIVEEVVAGPRPGRRGVHGAAQPAFRRRSRAAARSSIATRSSRTSSGTPSAAWSRRRAGSPGPSASAPRSYRRMVAFFETYDSAGDAERRRRRPST